ncbi:hypothetical protein Taro_037661 [Colocasia esculenta]|uniref:Uncharacterized protein n=1 Tax=Colocasia esculenta TaxID=4460 RepID=A0A843WAF6_COLES|nr:hypothetical protein [Colocasia esculenta]
MLMYVVGSALMATLCVCMGFSARIWAAYLFYVIISGIYQALACLVSVQCSRLLSNGQYILLFSVNNFLGLLFETVLQAAVVSINFPSSQVLTSLNTHTQTPKFPIVVEEIVGLSVFAQFTSFSGFFLIAMGIFIGTCFSDSRRNQSTHHPMQREEFQSLNSSDIEA